MVLVLLHYVLREISVPVKVLLFIYVQHSYKIHSFSLNDYSDKTASVGPAYYN